MGQIWAADEDKICGNVSAAVSPLYVKWVEPGDPQFFFEAKLEGRSLIMTAHLKNQDGTRSKILRGKSLYDDSLKIFEGHFDRITHVWIQTDPELADNIDVVNHLTWNGMHVKAAADQTWSGKQALRNGYQIDKVVTRGLPGEYVWVMVDYVKAP